MNFDYNKKYYSVNHNLNNVTLTSKDIGNIVYNSNTLVFYDFEAAIKQLGKSHTIIYEIMVPNGSYIEFLRNKQYSASKIYLKRVLQLDLTIIQELLQKVEKPKYSCFLLYWACYEGNLSVVKYLVSQTEEFIKEQDNYAIRIACANGHLDIVKFLHSKNADLHAVNEFGLRYAAKNGYLEIVKYLVDNGAIISAKKDQATLEAFNNNHMSILIYLLRHGGELPERHKNCPMALEAYEKARTVY